MTNCSFLFSSFLLLFCRVPVFCKECILITCADILYIDQCFCKIEADFSVHYNDDIRYYDVKDNV